MATIGSRKNRIWIVWRHSGKNTKEIADELSIKTGTVRNYISTILDKLEVKNRIEAITRFKEKGWFK